MCGDYAGQMAVLDEAVERAEAVGDRRTRSYGVLLRGVARTHSDPGFTVEDAFTEAEEALRVFEELGDEGLQARAWAFLAVHHTFRGHHREALKANERALTHATAAGDERAESDARMHIGNCLFFGDAPLEELVSYAERMLAQVGAKVRGRSLHAMHGRAHAMFGDFDIARKLIAERVAVHESFGNTFVAALARADLGEVEVLAGAPTVAEGYLRRYCEALEEAGETGFLSTTAAQLADAIYAQGRFEEAEQYTRISEEAASPDDYASQILWRSVRAKVIASDGRVGDGERLACEAVALAEDTDDINLRGDALMALAEVLRLAERAHEAVPVIQEALRLYEQKGNLVSADKARSLLAELRD